MIKTGIIFNVIPNELGQFNKPYFMCKKVIIMQVSSMSSILYWPYLDIATFLMTSGCNLIALKNRLNFKYLSKNYNNYFLLIYPSNNMDHFIS